MDPPPQQRGASLGRSGPAPFGLDGQATGIPKEISSTEEIVRRGDQAHHESWDSHVPQTRSSICAGLYALLFGGSIRVAESSLRALAQSSVTVPLGLVLAMALVAMLAVAFAWFCRWRLRRLQSRTRSTDVRRGYVAETLAPVLDGFPVDVYREGTTTLFIGQPVDFVHFDPDRGVTFIEVKSGAAQLSDKQRKLRSLVDAGAVRWETFRVG